MATSSPLPARRGSLVGPIILVALGAAFLLSNLRPDFSLWRLAVRYWPFLLIFWGLARLVEYGLARMTSRPIARTMTGGEVFLVVLICIAGSAMSSLERSEWRPWRVTRRGLEVLGENYEFPVQGSQEVPAGAGVLIQNSNGNVQVRGSDTKEIRITGRKSVRAFSRSSAEQADQSTPLEIVQEKGRLVVRTNQERLPGDRRISIDLEVTLPKTAAIRLEGRAGDWDVRDLAGPVEVDSRNAGVRVSGIAKDVRVNLGRSDIVRAVDVKGNIEITGRGGDIELQKVAGTVSINGDFSGVIRVQDVAKPVKYASSRTELSFEKLPGQMEMDSGSVSIENVIGPLKLHELAARSKSGRDIRIDGFTKDVDISARRGDIDLRTGKLPLSNIQVETRSGSIELAVPSNAAFGIHAKAENGSVSSEFGHVAKVEERGKARSAEIRGGPAGASAQVRLVTDRGDISVKKIGGTVEVQRL